MKQNPEFLLRDVADSLVLVPVGSATNRFPGMITLNETGKLLWEALATDQTAETLTALLLENYQVERAQAEADVQLFLQKLCSVGAIIVEEQG